MKGFSSLQRRLSILVLVVGTCLSSQLYAKGVLLLDGNALQKSMASLNTALMHSDAPYNAITIEHFSAQDPSVLQNLLEKIPKTFWHKMRYINLGVKTANNRFNTVRGPFMNAKHLKILRIIPSGGKPAILVIDPTYIVNGQDSFFVYFIGYDIEVPVSNTVFTKFLSEFEVNRQLSKVHLLINNKIQVQLASNWSPKQPLSAFYVSVNLNNVNAKNAEKIFHAFKKFHYDSHAAIGVGLMGSDKLSASEKKIILNAAKDYIQTLKNKDVSVLAMSASGWHKGDLDIMVPDNNIKKRFNKGAWGGISGATQKKVAAQALSIKQSAYDFAGKTAPTSNAETLPKTSGAFIEKVNSLHGIEEGLSHKPQQPSFENMNISLKQEIKKSNGSQA